MLDLYGRDIGTTLPFGHGSEPHPARHPWPEGTRVSAGGSARRGSYFLEVYPPGQDTLIRGDGGTPGQAEDAAWNRYRRHVHCPDTANGSHQWAPGRYRNGVGVCPCGARRSHVFTAEDLGQICHTCGVGTLDPRIESGVILCPEHSVPEWESELMVTAMAARVARTVRLGDEHSVAMVQAISEVEEGWSIVTDEPAPAPTFAAQSGHCDVLQTFPNLVGPAVPVPRTNGGIRLILGDGRRIDIEPAGQASLLSYDLSEKAWTRVPLQAPGSPGGL